MSTSFNRLGALPTSPTTVVFLNGGTLQATSTTASGANRGFAVGPATGTGSGTIDVPTTGAGTAEIQGVIANNGSGVGSLVKTGAGQLTLNSAGNTYTGSTSVLGGILSISGGSQIGPAPASPADLIFLNGGTLQFTGNITTTPLSANRRIVLGPAGGGGAGTIDIADTKTVRIAGALKDNTGGTGNFVKDGLGTLRLEGNSSYTGTTSVVNGTLRIGATNALPAATSLTLGSGANLTTLDLFDNDATTPTSFDQTVGAIAIAAGATAANNTITNSGTTTKTFTVNASATDSAFAGNITGSLNLTKNGANKLTLSGPNTYSGATSVNAGSLIVNGTHSGGGNYTVGANGSIGGTGAITLASAKNFTLAGNVSPGASPGTLTVNTSGGDGTTTGITDFQTGGSYTWEVNWQDGTAGVNWDVLDLDAVAVTATTGGFSIKITSMSRNTGLRGPMDAGDWNPESGEKRFAIAKSSTHSFTTAMLDKFSVVTTDFGNSNEGGFYLDVGDSGGELDIVYVPEPGTGAIAAMVASAALLRRRRNASLPQRHDSTELVEV